MRSAVRRTPAERDQATGEWVAARRSGLTVAAIATEAGVGKATVSRATAPEVPLPRRPVAPEIALGWAESGGRGRPSRPFPRHRLVDHKGRSAVGRGASPAGPHF